MVSVVVIGVRRIEERYQNVHVEKRDAHYSSLSSLTSSKSGLDAPGLG
jgi:hypothetical protein